MVDIAITWDVQTAQGDWYVQNGGLATGSDLESAVLVSLFTDQRASSDFPLPDGDDDLRGWWDDTYTGDLIGSRLWQFARAVKFGTSTLPLQVQDACQDALQWLLDDGVAASVTVNTGWVNATTVGIAILITEPNGIATPFNFSWAWNGL